ncbi:response regulator [Brevundimonas diminuta]|uniref:response regulator n=1 Tax=Brevundimonas diminuta TaxID=293 RepID=UPI0021D430F8|nr:response regulator [Brevundimonas diminuta]
MVLTNTAAMLEELGHSVATTDSGRQALELLTSGWPVELVIADHVMPGMTGTELLDTLRQQRPELPGILATGYADSEGREPGLRTRD